MNLKTQKFIYLLYLIYYITTVLVAQTINVHIFTDMTTEQLDVRRVPESDKIEALFLDFHWYHLGKNRRNKSERRQRLGRPEGKREKEKETVYSCVFSHQFNSIRKTLL